MTRVLLLSVALLLGGCSLLGGVPDESERRAAQLRQPPDVLADARLRTTSPAAAGAQGDAADEAVPADADGYQLGRVDGRPVLDLGLPRNAAWAVVGRAIDRVGFELLGSDRDSGTHQIRYDGSVAPEVDVASDGGLLDALAFWQSAPDGAVQTYAVAVAERGKGTRVSIEGPDGDPVPSGAARQVLSVLSEQLKP